jgi:endonuclease YncB( thermonuclease family)
MTYFTVTKIIDGDTFEVSPNWKWGFKYGDRVRPLGYDTPERNQPGFEEATLKLKKLILGKKVRLSKIIKLSYGRLLCRVHFKGRDLADFFPEYKV